MGKQVIDYRGISPQTENGSSDRALIVVCVVCGFLIWLLVFPLNWFGDFLESNRFADLGFFVCIILFFVALAAAWIAGVAGLVIASKQRFKPWVFWISTLSLLNAGYVTYALLDGLGRI